MAVTHNVATRTNLATTVITDIDAEVGAGNIEFYEAALLIATIPLQDPASTNIAAGVAIFDQTIGPTVVTTPTVGSGIDNFIITDNLGVDVVLGSVGLAAEDINLTSVTYSAGESIQITSLTYTAPV